METISREIVGQMDIQADRAEVWKAWTTEEGATGFFAPRAKVELHPGGAYEMYFNPEGKAGERGGEGMPFLAIQEPEFLSFTWNAPPHLPHVRGQMTFMEIRLEALENTQTRVRLRHSGWGNGEEWDAAFSYFQRAWLQTVLPRLKYYLEIGPIDWFNPPTV